jgi:hypothetical protein
MSDQHKTISIAFLLQFAGAAAILAAAFFAPLPERVAVLSGAAAIAFGKAFSRFGG